MTASKRVARAKYVCVRCMNATPRWPGSSCRRCGAFSGGAVVTIDEAQVRGVALPMSLVGDATKASRARYRTGILGLDRILSHEGGIVPGASVLLSSIPGGGKTTLFLAAAGAVSRGRGRRVVYASAEQDVPALHGLAEKLGVAERDRLLPIAVRSLDDVEAALRSQPCLMVVDSATELATHARTQPAAVVAALHQIAHEHEVATVITAHVTRDGTPRGGPEVEHATDTVLALSGDPRTSPMRELSATKNRHGDTTITARLRMTSAGFVDHDESPAIPRRALGPGCALGVVRVDGKPTLVEVEAMISTTTSNPRRITAHGCHAARVTTLVAILEREGTTIAGDVTVRLAGGVASNGVTLDAAIFGAVWSAATHRALPSSTSTCLAGEVGLDGALRPVDFEIPGELRLLGKPGASLVSSLARSHLAVAT